MSDLYTIECHQGAPLSSWSEPDTLENILDRYFEQWQDQTDEPDSLTREQFTAELFQDLWDCTLVKQPKNTEDLTTCNFPKEDCLVIGQDEGGFYTDSGYLTAEENDAHNKWHKEKKS